jgi:hypothetical protein
VFSSLVKVLPPAIIVILAAGACAGKTAANASSSFRLEPFVPYKPRFSDAPFTILDYQNRNEGRVMPAWTAAYLEGGARAVEALPAWNGKYCFVMEQSGVDLETLLRWVLSFRVERAFPQMALRRVFQRWTAGITEPPDNVYGSYFEKVLKMCATSFWPDAESSGFFWLKIRYTENAEEEEDSAFPRGEVYRVLICASIEKARFEAGINSIYKSISSEKTDSRAQISASDRLIENFWRGF